MTNSVRNFIRNEADQYMVPNPVIPSHDEWLAMEAHKATKFLNARLVRDRKPEPAPVVEPQPVAWYYRHQGSKGRAKRCASFDDAMYLMMDCHGEGRIGPLFK